MALVLGIVNYGFWFNDSLSLRQGVREGARRAVVLNQSGCAGTGMAAYVCVTEAQIGTSGQGYAKVWAPDGWVRGGRLVACGVVKAVNFTGFVPLPAGGLIKSKTTMSIENVPMVLPTDTTWEDPLMPGSWGSWSWCTP